MNQIFIMIDINLGTVNILTRENVLGIIEQI